jgi:deferrochelatase/peroxidase EfeB
VTREITRRQLLAGSGLATAGLVGAGVPGVALGARDAGASEANGADPAGGSSTPIPFFGDHQAGIATPEQARMVFAAYDVTASDAAGLAALLAQWSAASARLTAGEGLDGPTDPLAPPADTGEALGLAASNLTITVGFGPTLFDGRFGLGPRRPAALVDLPAFAGDALDDSLSGGDLCIQACADDAQVAFHAVHNLTRLALGSATVRYLQLGFGRTASAGPGDETPRNLIGFHDGINNLDSTDADAMRHSVWVDSSADQRWMVGGTYLVARRIRIHLEEWDTTTLEAQEQTIGRKKASGAPLGPIDEPYSGNLEALGADGQPLIPNDAHIRVTAPVTNDGRAILRRGYSFADGIDPASGELDAGLYFICFQKDPRLQFIPIQTRLADIDALGQFLSPTGGGIFACPPGITADQAWGHELV